jgi:PAS domain S-box-containing protein
MTQPLRVLHLEDSPRDAEIVRHRLDDGLACTIVLANGRDSFEAALAREPYDLIISDYNLPGYDGVSALKHAQATQPDVPVILISGTVVEEQAVRCLHIGATDYLLKARLERLVPAVKRAVQEAEARRARKTVEAALGESESRKAAILDSVLDCIVTMDSAGIVIEFNAAAARTFGFTKAEAIGRPLADLIIPPRFRDRHRAGLARHVATGEGPLIGKLIEIVAVRSDGSEIPVELTITSIRSGAATIFTGVLRDITARRHADATRTRLAAIVDSSDDSILSLALDTTILSWNAGAERLFGYTASEMVGRSSQCLVPVGKHAEIIAMMEGAARGETGEALETQRIRKDGSVVEISVVASPMTDPDGRVTSVSTIARDITGRKRAEAELKRLSDRAQRYLDTAEVILLSLDLQGRITVMNRYGCSLLGSSAEELIGRDFIEACVPAGIRDETRRRLATVLSGPDSSIVENPIVTKSGDERLIEWRNTLLRDDDGRVVGTLSSGTDVTERTGAAEALRQAEERMRFALQHAKVGVWDMDFLTGVLQWSETLESQYGLKPGTFDQTFEGFVARIHPDDRAAVLETIRNATTSGADFVTLHRTTRADGTVRWLSGAGRVLLGEDGSPVRAAGISQDITEQRSLEEQYQQAQKMEAIGRLAAGVAHDFNNLLTVILGFCELLLPDLDRADSRRADVTEIQKAGTRAAGLTRQLLAFSRKEIIEPKLLDLNAIVADIRVLIERLIGEDVKVVLGVGDALAPVMCDRGQVEQIILNLAVNARDAMPTGGTLTIATANVEFSENEANPHGGVKAGRYVALSVTDTGTGMTPAVQARLFEPFFTTKGIGKGTGLGLATVHGIVTRYDGSFDVDSELGRGTSFTVYFPRADAAAPVVAAPPPETRQTAGVQTVLVVEDEQGLRELTKRLLVRHGYTVLVAANADEAEQLFGANPSIDLLLTDVVMPGASGPDLVGRLVERRPGLKVIYMSGYTDDAIVHHGVLDPGIAFLHKPFSSETLGRKLREVLEQ